MNTFTLASLKLSVSSGLAMQPLFHNGKLIITLIFTNIEERLPEGDLFCILYRGVI